MSFQKIAYVVWEIFDDFQTLSLKYEKIWDTLSIVESKLLFWFLLVLVARAQIRHACYQCKELPAGLYSTQ